MNFIKIAWRDISSIFKNRFLRVSVTAIIVVPLLYSLLYLAAFWDPYSKLSSMPVAIVNQDKGAIKDGEKVNYGDDMVDSIKENDKIGWRFVSLEDADKGLKGDKYYAIFVIPESFSKDVMSAKDGAPKQPKILYSANEKRNFLAAQINKNVMGELRTEIIKTISENYTKVTFDSLYEVKDGMKKAADGSKELADGMNTLNDNVPKMQDGVQKLYDGSGQLKDGLGTLKGKIPELSNGVTRLYDGSAQLKDGIGTLKGKVDKATVALSKYYPQIANLLSPEGVNSIKGIMNSADKLVNADTSMLSMVPELMTQENMALAQKTTNDLKAANIGALMQNPMIAQAKGLMTEENINNLNKLAKDANDLSGFQFDRFKGLGVVVKNSDGLLSMVNDANTLYSKVDQNKLLPIMNLAQNSDKVLGLVKEAQTLQGSLDQTKLQPILYLAQNDPARQQLLGLVDNANKFVASIDMTKLQPLLSLTQNKDLMTNVENGMAALNNFDVDKTKAMLDAQKTQSQQFIAAAKQLNDAVTAINANPQATQEQKNAQLAVVAAKYQALVNTTSTSMQSSATAMAGLEQNLNTLAGVKATVGALPMDQIKTSVGYLNGQLPTMQQLLTAYSANKAQINGVLDGVKYLNAALPQIKGLYDSYDTNVKPLLNGVPQSAMYAKSLLPDVQKLQGDLAANNESITALKTTLTPENIQYIKVFASKLPAVKADLDSNAKNIEVAKALLQQANKPELKETIGKLEVVAADVEKAKPIIAKLEAQMTPENMTKLAQAPQLVTELTSMQKQLQNNAKLLEVAQSALTDGNVEMAKNVIAAVPQLTDGVNKLADGSTQLKDGLGLLNGNIPTLSDGVNKLADGSAQLRDGLGELNGKLPELADGSQKLTDGSKELNEKITEGSDKLNTNLVNDSETMGKFVGKPVIMDENPINPVKDYGTGFAPYFIPLSLWVGALMMFFVITEKVDDDVEASSGSIVLGKFLSYGYIGILQAILASVVVLALGLKPANVTLYILFNIFMSLVFIAIIQSLIFLLGQVGRLLAIVLLILQLTSCAGTFPLEVVPNFFKVLNPFMPFTYCVSALREAISGVDYAVFSKDVSVLAGIMVAFLVVSILMKGHADKVQAKVRARKEEAMTV